jgi:hypothetical protein
VSPLWRSIAAPGLAVGAPSSKNDPGATSEMQRFYRLETGFW